MKALLALVPVTIFALASCGSNGANPPTSSGDPTTTEGNGPIKTCRVTCNTAADCAGQGPLQDASHYTCEAKRCEWRGCQSDTECTSATMSDKVACAPVPGEDVSTCVPTCQTAADCAIPGNPLGDAAHFACNSGKCEWAGCTSTSDCTTALQSDRFACEKPEGALVPTCVPTCDTSADCAVPGSKLNDAGHFACKAHRCEWLGCKSTAECSADLHLSNVVCE
jgi:hypothetical protein